VSGDRGGLEPQDLGVVEAEVIGGRGHWGEGRGFLPVPTTNRCADV
jgi:hypothetical protein